MHQQKASIFSANRRNCFSSSNYNVFLFSKVVLRNFEWAELLLLSISREKLGFLEKYKKFIELKKKCGWRFGWVAQLLHYRLLPSALLAINEM